MSNQLRKLPIRHRFRLPNSLAIFAAALLFVSSVVAYKDDRVAQTSAQENASSAQVASTQSDGVSNVAKRKSRGLNLGLLLFRRG